MKRLSIDIETFSSVDIKSAGLYAYAQSPDFQILLFAYSVDGATPQIVDLAQGEALPQEIINAIFDPAIIKTAYNAAFEWYCLSIHFKQLLPIEQWRCTMHHGLYCGYPAGLAAVGKALRLAEDKQKLSTGSALIRKFCVPRKPTKTDKRERVLPHHEPEKWQLFKEYCKQDVMTEMEVAQKLEPFEVPADELQLWALDQIINLRGVLIDRDMVNGAIFIDNQEREELMEEAKNLTGLDNPNSRDQLLNWLNEELDDDLQNLQAATVKSLIGDLDDGLAKRVLEIKQGLSKTSTSKYSAMQASMCADNRIRGILQSYGANRTGRYAGRLIQPQNFPRGSIKNIELAKALIKRRDIDGIRLAFGNVAETLKSAIRSSIIAKAGTTLCVSDFSAIEARVIAWVANEKWRMDVFATHGKIYEASASAMFHVPIEQIGKGSDLRQKGKVAELALGYGGSKGALIAMGADKLGLDDAEMDDIVQRWRASSPNIAKLWYSVGNAALNTLKTGISHQAGKCTFRYENANGLSFLTIELPSGRKLYYAEPRIGVGKFGNEALQYLNAEKGKFIYVDTFGGKLVENIIQAIARDCLVVAMKRLTADGYDIIFHVHDEIVAESNKGVDRMNEILATPIPWADGLILKGDGFESDFYRKD